MDNIKGSYSRHAEYTLELSQTNYKLQIVHKDFLIVVINWLRK